MVPRILPESGPAINAPLPYHAAVTDGVTVGRKKKAPGAGKTAAQTGALIRKL